MKVQVNQEMCEGHGKCQKSAPEVFELREDDVSYVLMENVPEEIEPAVERAIRLCPRQAISWVAGS